ncbi:OmpA family protein [Chitinophaga caseinilytica]|uniref:OmpA family protein n=1 Tax=Chitinophaga caseinilytica TaxID=2267521 RepID=UPI003C2C5F35
MTLPAVNLRSLLFFVAAALLTSCAASKKGTSHAYMTKQYKELKKVLNEADVSILNDSLKVIFPNNVMFATNSDQLKDEIKPTFGRFAEVLNKFDKTKILVTGYTDNTGTDQINNDLSEKRAVSGKNQLTASGVAGDRLFTWGLGSRHPIATNDSEDGRSKNRRIEFVILYDVKPESK